MYPKLQRDDGDDHDNAWNIYLDRINTYIRSIGIPCAHHVGDDDNDGGDDEDVDAGLAMLWRRKLGSRHPGHTGQRCLHHIVRDAYTLYCARCLRLYIVHNTHHVFETTFYR